MRLIAMLRLRLRSLFARRKVDEELEEELRYHLEREIDAGRAAGLDPAEARYAALRSIKDIEQRKEECRDMRGVNLLQTVMGDLRYALRTMRASPAYALTAVLSLALGIGANTAIFTVVNSVLLRPLPFPQSERLFQLWESKPEKGFSRNVVNPINFLDWRDRTHSFEGMAAFVSGSTDVSGMGDPIALPAMSVSPEFFSILKVNPVLGRSFLPQEGIPGNEHVAILSYGVWQSRFAGNPKVLGRSIVLDGEPATVVGVMPRGLAFPKFKAEIWQPLPITRSKDWKSGRYLSVVARLKQDVGIQQAREELGRVGRQLAVERPDFDEGWTVEAVAMLADATQNVRLPLLVLLAAVGLVLLIACANVANLLLMRAAGRMREIALRAALGASRGRLLQQLLSESLVLVLVACLAGLAMAYGGVKALLSLIPNQSQLPRLDAIHMDGRVFLFTAGLSIFSALLFGLVPSLQVSQVSPQQTFQFGSLRTTARSSFRQALVVVEVALALVLLIGAGLMLRSFQKLISVQPGFDRDQVLTMGISTSPARYGDDRKRAAYFANVLREIRQLPGVKQVGSVHFLPLEERTSGSCFAPAGEPAPSPSRSPDAEFLVISPGYFESVRTPLLAGRSFDIRDGFDGPSVIMVNAQFAKQFFPDRNPIGQKLNLCWTVRNPAEIVGVIGDARQIELQRPPQPTIFVDNLQAPMYFGQLTVRTAGDPRRMTQAIQSAIHRLNPEQAVTQVQTLAEVFSDSVAQPRLQLVLLLIFGGIAGLLAVVGVYGVVSYSVAQRTREIGIRMALGAQAHEVRRTVLREGAALAALGTVIGLLGALALTRVVQTLLFQTPATDPLTLVSATALLMLVVLLAAFIPAQRASQVNPAITLRYD